MRKGSLVKQINDTLNALIHFDGVDKYANKKEVLRRMIVSRRTLEAYKRECCAFAKWVRAQHPNEGVNTLERLRPYAVEYLHRSKPNGNKYSAWTLRLERSAIAKLYGVSCNEICADLPIRRRMDITRSRGASTRARSYSAKNHPDVEMLGRAAGLRRMDFSRVRACDVRLDKDGYVYIYVDKSKGGKEREIRVDPDFAQSVLELAARRAPTERLIPQGMVPKKMDEHRNRRAYAQAMLQRFSRPLESLTRAEKYYCRGDAKGRVFDRQAMAMVSRWLGHGSFNRDTGKWEDRLNVIAGYYAI